MIQALTETDQGAFGGGIEQVRNDEMYTTIVDMLKGMGAAEVREPTPEADKAIVQEVIDKLSGKLIMEVSFGAPAERSARSSVMPVTIGYTDNTGQYHDLIKFGIVASKGPSGPKDVCGLTKARLLQMIVDALNKQSVTSNRAEAVPQRQ